MSFASPSGLSYMDVLIVGGPILPTDISTFCRRARAVLANGRSGPVFVDVAAVVDADASTVNALARVQLDAKRLGREVRLVSAGSELRELLDLMGLCEALPLCGELVVEPRGQAEHREPPRSVEEETDPGDLTV